MRGMVGTLNSDPPATFAQMASKTLSKKDQRADYDTHRRETIAHVYHAGNARPVFFSHHDATITLAFKFDKEHIPNTEASKVIEKLFPTRWGIDRSNLGTTLLAFNSKEETDAIFAAPLPPCPFPIQIHRVAQSLGRRVNIHVDSSILIRPEDRIVALQRLFEPYGRIIHTQFHYSSDGSYGLMPSFNFTLELKEGSPQEVKIPRVARLAGVNTLFHWRGPQYCYRCGDEAHTKLQCPQPPGFNIHTSDPIPIMARAFLP